jgi:hypothetical protein
MVRDLVQAEEEAVEWCSCRCVVVHVWHQQPWLANDGAGGGRIGIPVVLDRFVC